MKITKADMMLSDLKLAIALLTRELDKAANPFTLGAMRLREVVSHLQRLDYAETHERAKWWTIKYTDADRETVLPRSLPEAELKRIGDLVAQGFSSGEINARIRK